MYELNCDGQNHRSVYIAPRDDIAFAVEPDPGLEGLGVSLGGVGVVALIIGAILFASPGSRPTNPFKRAEFADAT